MFAHQTQLNRYLHLDGNNILTAVVPATPYNPKFVFSISSSRLFWKQYTIMACVCMQYYFSNLTKLQVCHCHGRKCEFISVTVLNHIFVRNSLSLHAWHIYSVLRLFTTNCQHQIILIGNKVRKWPQTLNNGTTHKVHAEKAVDDVTLGIKLSRLLLIHLSAPTTAISLIISPDSPHHNHDGVCLLELKDLLTYLCAQCFFGTLF